MLQWWFAFYHTSIEMCISSCKYIWLETSSCLYYYEMCNLLKKVQMTKSNTAYVLYCMWVCLGGIVMYPFETFKRLRPALWLTQHVYAISHKSVLLKQWQYARGMYVLFGGQRVQGATTNFIQFAYSNVPGQGIARHTSGKYSVKCHLKESNPACATMCDQDDETASKFPCSVP